MRGNKLLSEGDECDCLYFILSGTAAVSVSDGYYTQKQVEVLSKGDTIGQWGILH